MFFHYYTLGYAFPESQALSEIQKLLCEIHRLFGQVLIVEVIDGTRYYNVTYPIKERVMKLEITSPIVARTEKFQVIGRYLREQLTVNFRLIGAF
jgi:hypothetical protein